jgi:hypothetical protein
MFAVIVALRMVAASGMTSAQPALPARFAPVASAARHGRRDTLSQLLNLCRGGVEKKASSTWCHKIDEV